MQRYYRGTKRDARPGVESLLGDNTNQQIGLRYFFRVDHSLLVGFDRSPARHFAFDQQQDVSRLAPQ
jgi:hypothetical protein